MEKPVRLLPVLAVLLLLLISPGEIMGPTAAEARTCESASHRFKGTCIRPSNCAAICNTEGFPGGKCQGVRRRCFCVKPC
ncbi:hypothetical protein QJS10_CPB15g00139 [Acorus calamus]|uniref:Knottins-like domain-containing protein n=1 Tax=Acorus calamus TaxID=4465 RepID=A0AAV9DAL9_ACOCL|nr:hypothetical protein QJS10_CPB15g00139 [Acorus calamus]